MYDPQFWLCQTPHQQSASRNDGFKDPVESRGGDGGLTTGRRLSDAPHRRAWIIPVVAAEAVVEALPERAREALGRVRDAREAVLGL